MSQDLAWRPNATDLLVGKGNQEGTKVGTHSAVVSIAMSSLVSALYIDANECQTSNDIGSFLKKDGLSNQPVHAENLMIVKTCRDYFCQTQAIPYLFSLPFSTLKQNMHAYNKKIYF